MREFLHHLFFPRTSNNHKAKLLHHKSLFILLIAILLTEFVLISTEKKYTGVLGISANITVQELLDQTNKKRTENGLPPLSLNNQLANAATAKASDMFSKNYWAHVAPDGATPWGFIRGAGYEYLYAGENLARGFTTTTDVMEAWMASPGHKENILSPNYKEVGFAIQTGTLTGDETVLIVQEFGNRMKTDVAKAVTETSSQPTAAPTAVPSPRVVARVLTPIPITSGPTVTKFPTITPTPIPTRVPIPSITSIPSGRTLVAGFQSKPLMDAPTLKRSIVLGILGILLATLIIDIIFIERRKIIRMFVHNLDHIIYLTIIFTAVLIITRGGIL